MLFSFYCAEYANMITRVLVLCVVLFQTVYAAPASSPLEVQPESNTSTQETSNVVSENVLTKQASLNGDKIIPASEPVTFDKPLFQQSPSSDTITNLGVLPSSNVNTETSIHPPSRIDDVASVPKIESSFSTTSAASTIPSIGNPLMVADPIIQMILQKIQQLTQLVNSIVTSALGGLPLGIMPDLSPANNPNSMFGTPLNRMPDMSQLQQFPPSVINNSNLKPIYEKTIDEDNIKGTIKKYALNTNDPNAHGEVFTANLTVNDQNGGRRQQQKVASSRKTSESSQRAANMFSSFPGTGFPLSLWNSMPNLPGQMELTLPRLRIVRAAPSPELPFEVDLNDADTNIDTGNVLTKQASIGSNNLLQSSDPIKFDKPLFQQSTPDKTNENLSSGDAIDGTISVPVPVDPASEIETDTPTKVTSENAIVPFPSSPTALGGGTVMFPDPLMALIVQQILRRQQLMNGYWTSGYTGMMPPYMLTTSGNTIQSQLLGTSSPGITGSLARMPSVSLVSSTSSAFPSIEDTNLKPVYEKIINDGNVKGYVKKYAINDPYAQGELLTANVEVSGENVNGGRKKVTTSRRFTHRSRSGSSPFGLYSSVPFGKQQELEETIPKFKFMM